MPTGGGRARPTRRSASSGSSRRRPPRRRLDGVVRGLHVRPAPGPPHRRDPRPRPGRSTRPSTPACASATPARGRAAPAPRSTKAGRGSSSRVDARTGYEPDESVLARVLDALGDDRRRPRRRRAGRHPRRRGPHARAPPGRPGRQRRRPVPNLGGRWIEHDGTTPAPRRARAPARRGAGHPSPADLGAGAGRREEYEAEPARDIGCRRVGGRGVDHQAGVDCPVP